MNTKKPNPPTDAELSTWQFDIKHKCYLTPEIMQERIERAQLLPPSEIKNILILELKEARNTARDYQENYAWE